MSTRILRRAAELLAERRRFAIATIVESSGSVPAKPGARMLIHPDGTAEGTVGGAGLEERVKAAGREALERGPVQSIHRFDLQRRKTGGLDSLCGGSVSVSLEVIVPPPHLLLCGGGHVGLEVARLCPPLEYDHSVLDDRADYASPERFPHARACFAESPESFFDRPDSPSFTHVLLLGYAWRKDLEALVRLLPTEPAPWIGMIASVSKRKSLREAIAERGIDPARFDSLVRAPVGLPIGAETPAEIAVAILAEIVRDVRGAG